MKNVLKKIFPCAVVVSSLFLLQCLLVPKYSREVIEGNLIAEYYAEEKNHDVIFIGDCEVYGNFSPAVLWEEYGINSYIRGSVQQLIWQSYYLLEDTLRYEKPRVVILNVLSMKYDEPQKESYNRMTLEGMKWSKSKVDAINASMMEDEHFIEYVFPILRYHSRWNTLNQDDFIYMFNRKRVSHSGYYMRVDVKPVENVRQGKPLTNYEFGQNAYHYLEKITQLCKENDIQLILIKAPSLYPFWYDEWDEQMRDYAKENDLMYINFLDLIGVTGLDFSTDTYDAGLHMNLSGAEKITRYLGQVLQDEVGLPNQRGKEELESIWEEKLRLYEQEREYQYTMMMEEGRK